MLMRYSVFSRLREPARTKPVAALWFFRGTVYLSETGGPAAAEGACRSALLVFPGVAEASAGGASWTTDLEERFFVRLSLRSGW